MLSISNQKLDFVETLFSEHIMLAAEEILDNKKVSLSESAIKKTTYQYSGETKEMVHLLKKGINTTEGFCTCTYYKKNEECPHILAALMLYRSQKDQLNLVKPRVANKSKHGLDLSIILKKTKSADLEAFIRSYAKKDRKFLISLKTHFAHTIELKDNAAKYKNILDGIVSPIATREKAAKKTDIKHLIQICGDFCHQANDLISLTEYTEAFDILKVVSNKWEYVKSHFIQEKSEAYNLQQLLFSTWEFLITKDLAPELMIKIKNHLSDLLEKSYFTPLFASYNLSEIAYKLSESDFEERLKIRELFAEGFERYALPHSPFIMAIQLRMATKKNETKVIHEVLNHPKHLPSIIDYLCEVKAFVKARALLDFIEGKEKLSFKLLERSQIISVGLKEWSQLISTTKQLLSHSKNIKFYRVAQASIPELKRGQLLKNIVTHLDKDSEDLSLILAIYASEDKWGKVIDRLESTNEVELMIRYAGHIYLFNSDRAAVLFESYMNQYLTDHIGNTATLHVQNVLMDLRKNSAADLANHLYQFVKSKFPKRIKRA